MGFLTDTKSTLSFGPRFLERKDRAALVRNRTKLWIHAIKLETEATTKNLRYGDRFVLTLAQGAEDGDQCRLSLSANAFRDQMFTALDAKIKEDGPYGPVVLTMVPSANGDAYDFEDYDPDASPFN